MSHFLHNETCPKCRDRGQDRSGNNLGVYSDGHKYCWACGYYEPGDITERYFKNTPVVSSKGLLYPEITSFSRQTIDHLKKYGLTDGEIHSNLKGHEEGYSYFDNNFYFVRRINPNGKPKVDLQGSVVGNEPIFTARSTGDCVVIVEDILSAIKVSRIVDSCALLKAAIHDTLIIRLANKYKRCHLWLDPNMYEKMANKLLPRLKPYFNEVKVIMSTKDPKEHSTNEIKQYITG